MAWESGIRKTTTFGQVDPEDAFYFTQLPEPLLSSELARLSLSTCVDGVDCISFQPAPAHLPSEDRYVVESFEINGGTWKLRAVFDGHAGPDAVEYVHKELPLRIKHALSTIPESDSSPSTVSDLFSNTIRAIDDDILADFLALFPGTGSPEDIAKLSDEEIRAIINDDGVHLRTVHRCMRGTTATIALIDPTGKHLWVACVGDSPAVLGVKDQGSDLWKTTVLSSNHNGTDAGEAERIRKEHPGEPECVLNGRVLGAIAVTRAIGDHEFKLPKVYTERVFLNTQPGFRVHSSVHEFTKRNLTPPYVSNVPDVHHVELDAGAETYLIVASDGLLERYDDTPDKRSVPIVADLVGGWFQAVTAAADGSNRALALLRTALGGDNEEKVSASMTLEIDSKWMDDLTIIVEHL